MTESHKTRRRRGQERIRVTRACDTCKRKKLRCTGTLPCALCHRNEEKCEYNAKYKRGKIPQIPTMRAPTNMTVDSPLMTEKSVQANATSSYTPLPPKRNSRSPSLIHDDRCSKREKRSTDEFQNIEEGKATIDGTLNPNTIYEASISSTRSSPEPNGTGQDGHYVGPSSGVSFLLRVQKRLHESFQFSAIEPIFSFGDPNDSQPHSNDSQFLVLPSIQDARALVARYFEFSFPTVRFLHQGTIENYLEGFYSGVYSSQERGDQAIKALVLMVLAQGKQYLAADDPAGESVNSNVYFQASERNLSSETGAVKLTSIQARLSQCFYLLSNSKINYCWNLFGTTARLALALGMNRRRHKTATLDCVEEESRKRVFWCAYSLDNYLSSALGRPKIFHDEDIDQELPACVDDSQLSQAQISPPRNEGQSIMLAPIFLVKLSRIMSGVLRDFYGIIPKPLEDQVKIAQTYSLRLAEWRSDIGDFMDTPNIELLQITYQRQYSVLNLQYAHTQVLLYRPFILRNLAYLGRGLDHNHSHLQESLEDNVKNCLRAACKTLEIFEDLCKNQRMHKCFWSTHYYVFCAIVVLYVYDIQSQFNSTPDCRDYLKIGEAAQHELAKWGSKTSFTQRYAVVLEKMRQEALRIRRYLADTHETQGSAGIFENIDTHQTMFTPCSNDSQSLGQSIDEGIYGSISDEWMLNMVDETSPASYLANLTGWSDFDSLVLTGSGELGQFFPEPHVNAQ